jgi:hypothetical protein
MRIQFQVLFGMRQSGTFQRNRRARLYLPRLVPLHWIGQGLGKFKSFFLFLQFLNEFEILCRFIVISKAIYSN